MQLEPARHRGFIIGSDPASDGRTIWKARVRDPNSPLDGQKLIVASVHGNLELARGLNIHFAVGSVDTPSGTKALRAVDVRLETI